MWELFLGSKLKKVKKIILFKTSKTELGNDRRQFLGVGVFVLVTSCLYNRTRRHRLCKECSQKEVCYTKQNFLKVPLVLMSPILDT